MKHLYLLIMPLLLAACSLEMSDNGALDGYWHMERVDTLSTGGKFDLSQVRRFWAVQHNLLQVMDYDGDWQPLLLRFDYSGSALRLHTPYYYNRLEGDTPLQNPEDLRQYGINAMDETFQVETLNGSKMVLKSGDLRITLKKH